MTKLSELRGLLRPDQVAQEPSLEELFRAWKLNRWPGGFLKAPDWNDVETAFRAGLFQGDAYAHFTAAQAPEEWLREFDQLLWTYKEARAVTGPDYHALRAHLAKRIAPAPTDAPKPIAKLVILMDTHDMGQSLAPNPPFKSHRIMVTDWGRAEALPLGTYELAIAPSPEGSVVGNGVPSISKASAEGSNS